MCASIRYDNSSDWKQIFCRRLPKLGEPFGSVLTTYGGQYTMESSLNHWKDRVGIIASVACAIHCAATPILIACLPALTFTEWMASPRFHQIAALICIAMVSIAIWPAFMKFRDYHVLTLSSVGLGLLISAAFFLPDECCKNSIATDSSDSHAGSSDSHAGHSHAGHNHASQNLLSSETAASGHSQPSLASVVSPELIALVQPWMTPLGGILLVIAHGINLRRRVCSRSQCGCSGHPVTERVAAKGLVAIQSKVA